MSTHGLPRPDDLGLPPGQFLFYGVHMDAHSINRAVGAEIRAARAKRGYSQRELAERAGIGFSTLRRLESGERAADIPQLRTICCALRVDMAELVSRALAEVRDLDELGE